MRALSLLDLGFFIAETEASPKHVAGLLILKKPAGAKAAFARNLYREFLSFTEVKPPFNRVIDFSLTAMPHWRDAESVDLAQHVFFHKLPAGHNGRQDLFDFVAALHVPMLDRTRPLWEIHVIDGLSSGRFALYQKMHHAYADGVTMAGWTAQGLSESVTEMRLKPIWTAEHSAYNTRRDKRNAELLQSAWRQWVGASQRVLGIGRLAAMLMLESVKLTKNAIALPFVSTARTPLTGQVSAGRQFTSTTISMARVNALRKRTRSTINHVALTCLDGALRSYLSDLGVNLRRPITIQMPVNLRREGERQRATRSASSRWSCPARPTTPMCGCATSAFRCATCAPWSTAWPRRRSSPTPSSPDWWRRPPNC